MIKLQLWMCLSNLLVFLLNDHDLQQVVSEIKADAVKGSFWNTVTIEPNKTSVTE